MKRFRWSRRTTLFLSNNNFFKNFRFKNQAQLHTAFNAEILTIYFLFVQQPVASLDKKTRRSIRKNCISMKIYQNS